MLDNLKVISTSKQFQWSVEGKEAKLLSKKGIEIAHKEELERYLVCREDFFSR